MKSRRLNFELVRKLTRAYAPQKRGIVVLVVAACLGALFEVLTIAGVVILGTMTAEGKRVYRLEHDALPMSAELTSTMLIVATVVLVVLRFCMQMATAYMQSILCSRYMATERNRLLRAFLNASWTDKFRVRPADFQLLLTSYLDRTVGLLSGVSTGAVALANIVVLLISAAVVGPFVALGLSAIGVFLFFVLRPLAYWARRCSRADAAANKAYSREVTQTVGLARDIEVFAVADQAIARSEAVVEDTRKSLQKTLISAGLISPLYQAVIILVALCTLGLTIVSSDVPLEIWGIVVLLLLRMATYTLSLQTMYNQVMSKSVFLDELAMAENSYLRSAPPAGTVEAPVVQRIAFQNVSFSYGEEANVLHDLTFSVDAGELVGVVGPSGAGKSTLVKLLLKLHDADTGRVLVNDVALTDVTRKSWSKRMAYVPQEPILMSASIEDNIRFLRPDISTEAVLRAARSASIHETIMAMPDGYATVLDDRGSDLSGGQRQRIAIARALVTGPDVLILDEPTSALDALSEAAIRETLGKLKGATTVFIIAHRMALLGECDRLVVLDNGRLEAFGAPAKLASVSPFFRRSQLLARSEAQSV